MIMIVITMAMLVVMILIETGKTTSQSYEKFRRHFWIVLSPRHWLLMACLKQLCPCSSCPGLISSRAQDLSIQPENSKYDDGGVEVGEGVVWRGGDGDICGGRGQQDNGSVFGAMMIYLLRVHIH